MEQVALVGLPTVAFLLLAGGAFATRPRSVGNVPYIPDGVRRIVGQHRTQIEDTNVHFRRHKNQAAALAPEPTNPIEPEASPFAPGAPRSDDSLPPPSFPAAEPPPLAVPQPTVADPPPSPVVNIPLRNQITGVDSRADRLVRQVRNEVEALKKTLDDIALDRDEMLELDLHALMADPEHALTLPPAVLVRALVESGEENGRLQTRASRQRQKAMKLTQKLRDLERDDAGRRARLETLEEVIAALHANLEDLRYERDHLPLAAPAAPQALRPGPGQLPQASAGLSSRE
ncbi:MAG: hypothetical protein ABI782_00805 [Anaerolineaceae bacterium]